MRGEHEFRITGKPAVAILIVLAVVVGWRLAVTRDTVAPEVEENKTQV